MSDTIHHCFGGASPEAPKCLRRLGGQIYDIQHADKGSVARESQPPTVAYTLYQSTQSKLYPSILTFVFRPPRVQGNWLVGVPMKCWSGYQPQHCDINALLMVSRQRYLDFTGKMPLPRL